MNRAAEPGSEPLDHAVDRSRGGLSTKIHQLVDGKGRPLVIALTASQAGDSPMLEWLMADLAVARLGPGRPRNRPDEVAESGPAMLAQAAVVTVAGLGPVRSRRSRQRPGRARCDTRTTRISSRYHLNS